MVSRIGLGLAALGRPAYITSGREEDLPDRSVAGMRTRTFSMLDAAYAAGVRYVDAARSYGRAEEFLAGWLAERGHADVIVGSKWGYRYTGGWRLDAPAAGGQGDSLAMFTTQLAESRALLGDRLALYQVHSLTVDSGLFTDAPLLAALSRLRAEGAIIGLSASGPHQAETIRRALSLTVDGQQLFTAAEVTWNLLEPSAGPAAAEAAAAGWAILVKEAVANGRLTAAGGPPAPLTALAAARGSPRTRSRWPPRWPSRGHRLCCPAPSPARNWMRTWPRSPSASFRRSASPKPPTPTGRSGRPGHGTELFPIAPRGGLPGTVGRESRPRVTCRSRSR